MRRQLALLALPAVLAALGSVAPSAAAYEVCEPAPVAGVCAGYTCGPDPCVPSPFVYAYCEHPLPYNWCKIVNVGG